MQIPYTVKQLGGSCLAAFQASLGYKGITRSVIDWEPTPSENEMAVAYRPTDKIFKLDLYLDKRTPDQAGSAFVAVQSWLDSILQELDVPTLRFVPLAVVPEEYCHTSVVVFDDSGPLQCHFRLTSYLELRLAERVFRLECCLRDDRTLRPVERPAFGRGSVLRGAPR